MQHPNTNNWQTIVLAENDTGIRLRLKGTEILSFRTVFTLWETDENFRLFYLSILRDNNFESFFWEHPALISSLLDQPYELMLLRSRSLHLYKIDATSFASYFKTKEQIVNFDNLGKNARLIVPTPQAAMDGYKHFASVVRTAPLEQQHQLLRQIGSLMLERIHPEKYIWLNTAGSGVTWLHIRLDSRPKYYKTNAYKNAEFLK